MVRQPRLPVSVAPSVVAPHAYQLGVLCCLTSVISEVTTALDRQSNDFRDLLLAASTYISRSQNWAMHPARRSIGLRRQSCVPRPRVDRRTECRRNRHRTCRPVPSSQRPVLPTAWEVSRWRPPQSPQATRRNDLDADERWARIISVEGSSHVCIMMIFDVDFQRAATPCTRSILGRSSVLCGVDFVAGFVRWRAGRMVRVSMSEVVCTDVRSCLHALVVFGECSIHRGAADSADRFTDHGDGCPGRAHLNCEVDLRGGERFFAPG